VLHIPARSFSRLFAVLLLVSLSVPPIRPSQAAPTNSPAVQETAPTRSSASPLTVSLTLGSTTNQTAIVGLTLDSPVTFDDINLKLGVTPGLSLLSSNVPTRTILAAGQQLTFQAEIAGNTVEPQEVVVLAWGTHNHRAFNEVATLRVTAVNGQFAETVEPIDTLLPSPAQIVDTSPESDTSTPSATSALMTVSGQFNYNDHITRPMTITVSPDPQGLDPISIIRPIRKARVQIQYRFTSDPWWSTLAGSTYTERPYLINPAWSQRVVREMSGVGAASCGCRRGKSRRYWSQADVRSLCSTRDCGPTTPRYARPSSVAG